jgi:hypothetical protein
MQTLRREHWPAYSVDLGEGFRLRKERNGRQLEAICWLRTHELGREIVLNVNGSPQRSGVCRTPGRGAGSEGVVARRDDGTRVALTAVPAS